MGNIYDVVKLLGNIVNEHKGEPNTKGSAVYRDENGNETTILEFSSAKELEESQAALLAWLTEHKIYPTSVTAKIVPAPPELVSEDKPKKYPSIVFTVGGRIVELATV